jgi:hypothetical protein
MSDTLFPRHDSLHDVNGEFIFRVLPISEQTCIWGIAIKTLSGITGFRTTKETPVLHHTIRKNNIEKSWQYSENVCQSPQSKNEKRRIRA